jgi:hypothetical protein
LKKEKKGKQKELIIYSTNNNRKYPKSGTGSLQDIKQT